MSAAKNKESSITKMAFIGFPILVVASIAFVSYVAYQYDSSQKALEHDNAARAQATYDELGRLTILTGQPTNPQIRKIPSVFETFRYVYADFTVDKTIQAVFDDIHMNLRKQGFELKSLEARAGLDRTRDDTPDLYYVRGVNAGFEGAHGHLGVSINLSNDQAVQCLESAGKNCPFNAVVENGVATIDDPLGVMARTANTVSVSYALRQE